ncbi:MAG TPA: N-acetylmuramoyl-L-alanine amidase [Clostridiaceae bacterium]
MKNYKKLIFLSSLLLTILFVTSVSAKESKIVLLDPGHGGKDGGAVISDGTIEKDINLQICLKLRDELKKLGFTVLMTREKDEGLGKAISGKWTKRGDLNYRCDLKKTSNCDLFISIHQNTYPEEYCRGTQIWYADNIKSEELANMIQREVKEKLDATNRRVSKAAKDDYKVLRCEDIPSILIEGGFLTNTEERIKLKDSKYQQAFAKLIADDVNIFFNTIGKE